MGYFRLFYFFKKFRYFFSKHIITILLIMFCVSFFLMSFSSCFALYTGDDTYIDPYYAIYKKYDSICLDFIKRFDYFKTHNPDDDYVEVIYSSIRFHDYYIYYQTSTTNDGGISSIGAELIRNPYMRIVFYDPSNDNFVWGQSVYDDYMGLHDNIFDIRVWSTLSNYNFLLSSRVFYGQDVVKDEHYYIPQSLWHYRSQIMDDYFIHNKSVDEIELLYEMQESLDNIDETLDNSYNYMTDEPSSSSFSSSDLPSDSGVTDPTSSYVDGIFTTLYNRFTRDVGANDNLTINIPFTNKSFVIPYDYTSQFVPSGLKTFINTFWYFAFSIIIFKDIAHKFNKIRAGDIENLQNSNIKEDIL